MRKLFLLFTLFYFSKNLNLTAQQIIAQNENISPNNMRTMTFEDYLVQLAWTNSPEAEGGRYEIEARKEQIELAKKDWTRNLSAGFNFNDVSYPYFLVNTLGVKKYFGNTIDLSKLPTVATNPLWQVAIGVNIGDLLVRKNKVRFATSNKRISETDLNLIRQKIKAEILKRYQEFLVSIEIFKVRLQSLDATEANKNQISNLFSVNKASFQDYNEANKAYTDALEAKIKADSDIKIKKIAVEELIGVRWETIEKVRANFEQRK